jgi:hypothetical protein
MKKILLIFLVTLLFNNQSKAKDLALEYYERFIDRAKEKGFLYYAMAQTPSVPTQGGYGSAKSGQEAANRTAIEHCKKDYKATDCVITYIGTKKVLDIYTLKKIN